MHLKHPPANVAMFVVSFKVESPSSPHDGARAAQTRLQAYSNRPGSSPPLKRAPSRHHSMFGYSL
jgi:hypothetical protein